MMLVSIVGKGFHLAYPQNRRSSSYTNIPRTLATYYPPPPPPPPPPKSLPTLFIVLAAIVVIVIGITVGYFLISSPSPQAPAPTHTVTKTGQPFNTVTATAGEEETPTRTTTKTKPFVTTDSIPTTTTAGEEEKPTIYEADMVAQLGETLIVEDRFEVTFTKIEKTRYVEEEGTIFQASGEDVVLVVRFNIKNIAGEEFIPLIRMPVDEMVLVTKDNKEYNLIYPLLDLEEVESVTEQIRQQAKKINVDYAEELAPDEEREFTALFLIPDNVRPAVLYTTIYTHEFEAERVAIILEGS